MADNNKKNMKAQKRSADIDVMPSTSSRIVTGSVETKSPLTAAVAVGRRLRAKPGQLRSFLVAIVVIVIAAALVLLFVVLPAKEQSRKAEQATATTQTETKLALSALANNNNSLALYHAKRALQASPNNLRAIDLMALVTSKTNPAESMKYFTQELSLYKQQSNFDNGKINTLQYWVAAGLAENAGNKAEALKFYKAVVQGANMKDSYENDLARQSKETIQRLQ